MPFDQPILDQKLLAEAQAALHRYEATKQGAMRDLQSLLPAIDRSIAQAALTVRNIKF